ncbi:MAG: hypothetical protein ACI8UO_003791 [Verrucomicrobiales bacterium]|jgi:hypothetical protein
MMIHSVYFWLIDGLTDEQKAKFEGGLRKLFEIESVASGRFGTPAGTPAREGVTHNDFDFALFLEFTSVENHNTYQDCAEHHVFVDNFKAWFKSVNVHDTKFSS